MRVTLQKANIKPEFESHADEKKSERAQDTDYQGIDPGQSGKGKIMTNEQLGSHPLINFPRILL